jgi:plastocyanin
MKASFIVLAVVVVVIIGGAIWYMGQNSAYQQPTTATTAPTQAVASQPAAGQATSAVTISNFAFQPNSLSVATGTTVTWTNNDSMPHTVTADDGSFTSGPIAAGATFSHTFTAAGTVAYHCQFHASMHGSVTVTK